MKEIIIQPYNVFPQKELDNLSKSLQEIFSNVKIRQPKPIPRVAFYAPRNRYRADSLIRILRDEVPDTANVIGLTTFDISSSKGKLQDWGIMGLGFCPGKSCVVSTYRLHKKSKENQLFKLALHELGHTAGLQHCKVKNCFMRDAEGGNPIEDETEFCSKCKSKLISLGWNLK